MEKEKITIKKRRNNDKNVEKENKDIDIDIDISKKDKDINVKELPVNINSLDGKIILVNVGTSSEPATNDDIENVKERFEKLLKDHDINCLVYVTHHAVNMKIVN